MSLAVLAGAPAARAETLDCLISRGNLCFSTGCTNSGKGQRMVLDLAAGRFRLCPNRFSDRDCTEAPMQFDIRDTSIVGISKEGPEISARAVFMNRVTGALSTSLLAAGMSAVDFGSCEIPR
ncbi:hypothetical protein [Aestuariivirga sp.]|uniref:hypothetical protein n=1 Tax=Aestuariivirga sp. TaxID=2650926 RepID=UPI0025BDC6BE|nr:hypothetical protein [Aestuariivirga sp.]MCA3554455.1 hypothetical protein [Aestuariivirga sp.]